MIKLIPGKLYEDRAKEVFEYIGFSMTLNKHLKVDKCNETISTFPDGCGYHKDIKEWKSDFSVVKYIHLKDNGEVFISDKREKVDYLMAVKKVTITEGDSDE